jgi:hypothetical protein
MPSMTIARSIDAPTDRVFTTVAEIEQFSKARSSRRSGPGSARAFARRA